MANAVAVRETPGQIQTHRLNQEQIDLIKSVICKGATDEELRLFMYQCERTGLDPLARQIYSVKRREYRDGGWQEVRSIQTSIDGFRLIAERSGKYAGQAGPFWCGEDGEWLDAWVKSSPPAAAKVGVMRSDFTQPCWGVARFDAYAQTTKEGGYTKMWKTMGDVMIAKCAESLALRKAFPQELSGLYTGDEMQQADTADESKQIEQKAKDNIKESPKEPEPENATAKEPHEIPRPNGITMVKWASDYITQINLCTLPTDVAMYRNLNAAALEDLKTRGPKLYVKLEEAEKARLVALT